MSGFFFGTFSGVFWYLAGGFPVHFGGFFGTFGGGWYISGGLLVHFGEFIVQLGWFCGATRGGLRYNSGNFKYISGVFSTFCLVSFLDLFLTPSGSEWGVGAQAGCWVHPQNCHPPPPPIECPGLGLLVVHVAGPFTQISGMEVGEGMEGHGTKCDCTLSVCVTLLFESVLQGNVVDRPLVQGVNCLLWSKSLTGFGVGLWLWLGHGVWDGAWDMFRGCTWTPICMNNNSIPPTKTNCLHHVSYTCGP